jgi:hypothetical protein
MSAFPASSLVFRRGSRVEVPGYFSPIDYATGITGRCSYTLARIFLLSEIPSIAVEKDDPQPCWAILETDFSNSARLSKLSERDPKTALHNISYSDPPRAGRTTTSTLPERYPSCKSKPFQSEIDFETPGTQYP